MADTRADIQRDYESDMRVAEATMENDERKAMEMKIAAGDRKARRLDDLSAQQELDNARVKAASQFPLADPGAISGSTEAEILASAQRSHNFVVGQRESAAAEVRAQARGLAAVQYGPDGKPVLPSGDLIETKPKQRTAAEIKRDLDAAKEAGDEGKVLKLLRERGATRNLDRAQEQAVAEAAEARRS